MRSHQPTPTPHMKGDNRRQRETRPLQSPRRRPHQPPPTPHIKGDNGRQRETTGDKTTSEPKKPTTPTNTKAARSKVALRTPTVNCLGNKQKDRKTAHQNQLGKNTTRSPTTMTTKQKQEKRPEKHERKPEEGAREKPKGTPNKSTRNITKDKHQKSRSSWCYFGMIKAKANHLIHCQWGSP